MPILEKNEQWETLGFILLNFFGAIQLRAAENRILHTQKTELLDCSSSLTHWTGFEPRSPQKLPRMEEKGQGL
ncbi:MAG: hypothetical protein F6K32_11975 [Desertifilum sp. SIO1I2]|nr:hypothetical protein [Desertifilum sp. SIO1I2]